MRVIAEVVIINVRVRTFQKQMNCSSQTHRDDFFFLIFDILLFAIPTKSIVHFFLLVALFLCVV